MNLLRMVSRAISIFFILSLCAPVCFARETSNAKKFPSRRLLRRFVIELPNQCSSGCEQLVKNGAAKAGCKQVEIRHLSGHVHPCYLNRFFSLFFRSNSRPRYLRLDCSKEGKAATTKILGKYLREAGLDATTVEEDIIMTGQNHNAYQTVMRRRSLQWNIDEADSKQNGLRCTGSKLGAGSTVLVLDTGCKPRNSNYCKSFVDGSFQGNKCSDRHGHGTHVAGTVAHPIYGVAAKASVGCSQVLDENNSGSISGIVEAIEDAVQYAETLSRPLIINLSIAGLRSKILNNAVRDAERRGVFFAIAAGNQKINANLRSPASVASPRLTRVFIVGAHDENGEAASFTNFGNKVTISAGGVRIKSSGTDGQAVIFSGTSMASPTVAGAMAVLLSDENGLLTIILRMEREL